MDSEFYYIYDVIDKKNISILQGTTPQWCKQQKINYKSIQSLISERYLSSYSRYILPKNKDKIFTLVDFETGQEYDCITNNSILIHLNIPLKGNAKLVNQISKIKNGKSKEQNYASVGGRLFSLKGMVRPPYSQTKNEHLPKIKEVRKHYALQKRLRHNMRWRLWDALKKQDLTKNDNTMNLIGCSIDFLISHLESKFEPGMDWSNYGKNGWNVDHFLPCASFNLLDPDQQKVCFHYTNLRPMWERENTAKSSILPNGERAYSYNIK